ncbi:MAG: hypothetical protein KBD64_07985 [Gammaproteobacteria bacterium]|nr:hypothetical protein [Gammaproteobacteria bacterium]
MKKYIAIAFLLLSASKNFALDGLQNKEIVNLLSHIRNDCLGEFIKATHQRFITDFSHEIVAGMPGKKEIFTMKISTRDPVTPEQLIDDSEFVITFNSYPPKILCNINQL